VWDKKTSSTILINIIFNEYLLKKYLFKNNLKSIKMQNNKLMQIKGIYLRAK